MIDHRHYRAAIHLICSNQRNGQSTSDKVQRRIIIFLSNHKFKHWPSSNHFDAFCFSFSSGHFWAFQRRLIDLFQFKWNNNNQPHQPIQRINQSRTFFSIEFWYQSFLTQISLFDYCEKSQLIVGLIFSFKSFISRSVSLFHTTQKKIRLNTFNWYEWMMKKKNRKWVEVNGVLTL